MILKSKSKGFTLLETNIVLGLVVIIIAMGWSLNLAFSQKYQEDQFWQAFRQNWSYTVLKSRQDHARSRVAFYSTYVLFKVNLNEKIIRLNYPATMHFAGGQRNEEISSSGVAQAQTFRLISTLNPQYYDIKFQVGYGGQYDVDAFN